MIILSRFDGSWLVRLIRNINDRLVYVWDGNFCSISFNSRVFLNFFQRIVVPLGVAGILPVNFGR